VILFQNDIKRALAALGKDPLFRRLDEKQGEEFVVDEVVKAASFLANRSIGALIAIERKNSLVELVELGMKIDALVSREFIISIFNPESPLHDGGMIIRENRVLSVGSFFPLATDPDLERELGTRHRAAVGLSRDTDAVVIVVSEESGTISLAVEGNLTRSLDATSLNNLLLELLGVKKEPTTQRKILNRILGKREVEKPTL
jgi:diadenylate cyclase